MLYSRAPALRLARERAARANLHAGADRMCLDLLRRDRRLREALTSDGLESLDPLGPAPGIDAEARLTALESLGRLDDEQQSLAIMLFVDGMSQARSRCRRAATRTSSSTRPGRRASCRSCGARRIDASSCGSRRAAT